VSERPSATRLSRLTASIHRLSTLFIASSSTTPARHLRTNRAPSAFTAPRLSLYLPFFFVLTHFSFILRCNDDPYSHSGLDYLVGTQNVFKLPPFKDGTSILLLNINRFECFLSLFCVLSRLVRLVASALALVEPLSTLCVSSLSISLSPHLIWDDNQPRSRYLSYGTSGRFPALRWGHTPRGISRRARAIGRMQTVRLAAVDPGTDLQLGLTSVPHSHDGMPLHRQ
jgi:hypothetical protein